MTSGQVIIIIVLLFTIVQSYQSLSYFSRQPEKRHTYFDDYLINNSDKVVIIEVNDNDLNRGSEVTVKKRGKIEANNINILTTTSSTESEPKITTSTQSPEEEEEDLETLDCCYLGRLAGTRGYHCHVDFYAARIIRRNENRAHNKKLYFSGKHRNGLYGTQTMRRFESCIETRGALFHSCCKSASKFLRHGPRYDTAKRLHSG